MKKSFIAFCAALLLCCVNLFCTAQSKLENSLLWKISGNGLAEESYLFGTNHSVHYSFLDSVSGFWDAFNSAKNIVGEITYTQDSKTKSNPFSTLSEKDFLLPKDSSYRVLYNEEDYNIVNDFIQANKLIPVPLDQAPIRPGFLVLLASYKLRNSLEENDKQRETMDSWIIRAASLKNKNILQLDNNESYEEAVEKLFLFKAPLSEQTKFLLDFIKNNEHIKRIGSEINVAYRKQDLTSIFPCLLKDGKIISISEETLSPVIGYNRNKLWMEKIPEILKSGSSFIAVGALHLVGENGLIELLRKEGYTVEPVTQNKN